jgi:hypothetical protein
LWSINNEERKEKERKVMQAFRDKRNEKILKWRCGLCKQVPIDAIREYKNHSNKKHVEI